MSQTMHFSSGCEMVRSNDNISLQGDDLGQFYMRHPGHNSNGAGTRNDAISDLAVIGDHCNHSSDFIAASNNTLHDISGRHTLAYLELPATNMSLGQRNASGSLSPLPIWDIKNSRIATGQDHLFQSHSAGRKPEFIPTFTASQPPIQYDMSEHFQPHADWESPVRRFRYDECQVLVANTDQSPSEPYTSWVSHRFPLQQQMYNDLTTPASSTYVVDSFQDTNMRTYYQQPEMHNGTLQWPRPQLQLYNGDGTAILQHNVVTNKHYRPTPDLFPSTAAPEYCHTLFQVPDATRQRVFIRASVEHAQDFVLLRCPLGNCAQMLGSSRRSVTQHMRKMHDGGCEKLPAIDYDSKRRYKCNWPGCSTKTNRRSDLQKHHYEIHFRGARCHCQICGNEFTALRALKVHLKKPCSLSAVNNLVRKPQHQYPTDASMRDAMVRIGKFKELAVSN